MIKFFRKIRHNLISEGKTGKYFKYAIGEIILVVFGILIALSINNWNEQRKTDELELKLLFELKASIIESKKELTYSYDENKLTVQRFEFILSHLKSDLPESKAIDSCFYQIPFWVSPFVNYTAYESLKTKGLDIIKNETIKNGIVNLYDTQFARLINEYDKVEWINYETWTAPNFLNYFHKTDSYSNTYTSKDYNQLKNDLDFATWINTLMVVRYWGFSMMEPTLKDADELIDLIEKELQSRNYYD